MKTKPAAEIAEFLRPIAEEVGVEIVDVVFDQRKNALTVTIDREGGVDLIVCEKFHRAIDGPLDELDPTYGAPYTLNCSSCGLDRPFKTARDFERHMGEKVEIKFYAPIGGKKYCEGELCGFDGENVTVREGTEERTFPLAKCAKVSLYIEV